jgi:hypothetical protein
MLSVCGFMWISIQAHARCGHDGSKIIRKSVKSGRRQTELTTVTEKTSTKSPGGPFLTQIVICLTNEAEKGSVTTPAGTDAGQPAAQVYL